MQLHQPGYVPDHVVREAQRGQPALGHLGADHLVQVEGDPAVRQQGPGLRLADVVQQRGQPDDQVTVEPVPRLQRDRLPQHGEAVLVDILVPVMLVSLHPEPGHLGQHLVGHPGLHQDVDAERRIGRQHQLGQLAGDPLRGDDLQAGRLVGHCGAHLVRDREPQLGREPGGAQDAQRVVAERPFRRTRRAQHLLLERLQAAERVGELVPRQPGRHRVDGEITPGQVLLQGRAVPHIRFARGPPVLLAAVGGDLVERVALAQPDGAERDPDLPRPVGPAAGDLQHLVGGGVRGQVEVARLLAEKDVPDRTADQRELVAVAREQEADPGHGGHLLAQQRGDRFSLFVAHGHGHREYRPRGSRANGFFAGRGPF